MDPVRNHSAFTRVLAALVSLSLLIGLLISVTPAAAIPPGVSAPGTSFDRASSLGLTYPAPRSTDGIKLEGSRAIYYFTFTLESPTNLTFWFYNTQSSTRRLPKGGEVLKLYTGGGSKMANLQGAACPSNLTCFGGLYVPRLSAGTYFLAVDMSAYYAMSSSPIGWLTWKADYLDGSQPASALPWYSRGDLYGQMPAETRSHWYKVNMTSGQSGSLKLYGASGSNLNVYLYSDAAPTRAFASGSLTRYPESFSFTVPSRARFIYIQVDNASKTSSEYTIQLSR
jgi:hypothetical protein